MIEKLTKDEDEQLIWGYNVVCGTTNSRFNEITEGKDGNITFEGVVIPAKKPLLKKIFPFL